MSDFTLLVGTKIDSSKVQQQLDLISQKTSMKVKLDIHGNELGKFKTIVTQGKDSLGQLVTTTEKFNKEGKSLGNVVTSVTKNFKQADTEIKKTGFSLRTLGGDFVTTTLKVAKFGASTKIIGLFQSAITESIQAVREFDDALTEFKKVSDLNGEGLKNYTQLLGNMGEEVARTSTEMLESATTFKKSGFSEDDSAQLAKIAELYKNIADTQVSSGEASSFLVSQMKSFNFTADDTITILDSMNNIANNMAVGTNDLQLALEKSGSALGTLGNSFEQSIALVEAGTAIMQNQGSKVGRGLRSIGIELSKMSTESEYLSDASGKVAVAFKDENGELKNTYEILNDLAPQWKTLNDEQKTQLAQSVAGKLCLAFIDLTNGEKETQQTK